MERGQLAYYTSAALQRERESPKSQKLRSQRSRLNHPKKAFQTSSIFKLRNPPPSFSQKAKEMSVDSEKHNIVSTEKQPSHLG